MKSGVFRSNLPRGKAGLKRHLEFDLRKLIRNPASKSQVRKTKGRARYGSAVTTVADTTPVTSVRLATHVD
jgi:hypothetical protein